jgi:hypothetical protein
MSPTIAIITHASAKAKMYKKYNEEAEKQERKRQPSRRYLYTQNHNALPLHHHPMYIVQ